jgi:predicted nuclease of restriction endonuclease-like RecB superfamily
MSNQFIVLRGESFSLQHDESEYDQEKSGQCNRCHRLCEEQPTKHRPEHRRSVRDEIELDRTEPRQQIEVQQVPNRAHEHAEKHDGENPPCGHLCEPDGFWTPEYLNEKLAKIRQADVDNLLLAVSEQLDCTNEDIDLGADRVLWFKTGIHVYDVADLADEYAL